MNNLVSTEFDRAIVFRTVDEEVYWSSVNDGSIWLRSSTYYRKIEDKARQDRSEGINGSSMLLPLRFQANGGAQILMEGPGSVGCEIVEHYIISLHGASISKAVHEGFGGCTFGVKNLDRLSAEVLYQVSKQYPANGYRYGAVSYQNTALSLSMNPDNSAVCLNGSPSQYVKSINTDVLRKAPISPFIEQDEWRIVIFLENTGKVDPMEPIKINVDPSNFYEYIPPNA